ncbi:hypothetical protein [uncultured Alistipes sp.]|uniref:hypothetical protein n=1 Tax=uncultured Alistipes sp. TaxID=538949 RepID=UPI00266FC9D9|nr:hypothetical protein [uncultured Alistipes sp.]
MIGRIQHPSYPAAALTAANPLLLTGEVAYESDTRRHKVGDGATAWCDLPYANNYEHPASHPAAIIDQDAEHRFVSDDEKTVWNSALTSASVKRIAGPMTAEEFAALTPDAQTLYIITD